MEITLPAGPPRPLFSLAHTIFQCNPIRDQNSWDSRVYICTLGVCVCYRIPIDHFCITQLITLQHILVTNKDGLVTLMFDTVCQSMVFARARSLYLGYTKGTRQGWRSPWAT